MAVSFDVCVRGGGIVAHALALQLAGQRLRVALHATPVKSATAPVADVRAYALNTASRGLLEGLRCWPDDVHATPVLSMEVHGDQGGEVRFDATTVGESALNWIVDVPALEQLLSDAVRFQPQIHPVQEPVAAALTVICEGRNSSTRDSLGVEFEVHAYGQTAIAARVQCERAHEQCARQWFAGSEVLALLPLDGPEGSTCALVWSVAEDRAPGLLASTPEDFCVALQSASHNALQLTTDRRAWPLQVATAQRWSGHNEYGAWTLAGDAAHTVHPLAGQGLNLGLGDVAELARTLDTRAYWRSAGDPRLLRSYERARKAALAAVGASGDGLQRLFAHDHPSMQTLRNWGMQRFNQFSPLKDWVARRAMGL